VRVWDSSVRHHAVERGRKKLRIWGSGENFTLRKVKFTLSLGDVVDSIELLELVFEQPYQVVFPMGA